MSKFRAVSEACYCRHCGWLVAAEGITIPAHLDVPKDERALPERCSDSACQSREEVTIVGGIVMSVREAHRQT